VAGYGLIDLDQTTARLCGVAAGVWRFDPQLTLAARLSSLAMELQRVIELYSPQAVCVEQAFVAQNIRSALYLGHARGVVLAHCHRAGLDVFELAPTAVKKAVVAHGRAGKDTIAHALSSLLGIDFKNLPYDASDAMGIAYAHALREKMARARGCTVQILEQEERRQRQEKKRAGGSRWATFGGQTRSSRGKNSRFELLLKSDGSKK
jgi:crossover junction endodeoxyribonuclease RuvC